MCIYIYLCMYEQKMYLYMKICIWLNVYIHKHNYTQMCISKCTHKMFMHVLKHYVFLVTTYVIICVYLRLLGPTKTEQTKYINTIQLTLNVQACKIKNTITRKGTQRRMIKTYGNGYRHNQVCNILDLQTLKINCLLRLLPSFL